MAYRNLARKHHPDLLRSQGVPVDKIANAEEILKRGGNFFGWEMQRYGPLLAGAVATAFILWMLMA